MEFFVVPATVLSPALERATFPTCFYINSSDRIQVVRLAGSPHIDLERVVFPGQRLLFEAPLEAVLEVYAGEDNVQLEQSWDCSELACL